MTEFIYNVLAGVLSLSILYGINLMSSPKTAVKGNLIGAISMAIAIVVTLLKDQTLSLPVLWVGLAVGSGIGLYLSAKVKMIQMPQMVALLNGLGGGASALVALVVLVDTGTQDIFIKTTAGLALIIGVITLLGSLVAAGKLHQILPQKPIIFKSHSLINNASILATLCALIMLVNSPLDTPIMWSVILLLLSSFFGIWFTIRVGGADMPVTISLLNSLSGVAGGIAGLAIKDPLLVAAGGIVGASGLLLTQVMCRGMNRSLLDILLGKTSSSGQEKVVQEKVEIVDSQTTQSSTQSAELKTQSTANKAPSEAPAEIQESRLSLLLNAAKKVIIIPGYGMALAQAQHKVKQLVDSLEAKGAQVVYAIHPVAGRMPGHMNVLLAEANVDYEQLIEMHDVNPQFAESDLVVIVGANDVVNPAAIEAVGTPIYGMPILRADEAKNVVICNFDTKPGYAGVENPLYKKAGVFMLLGDAAQTVGQLIDLANNKLNTNKPSQNTINPNHTDKISADSSPAEAQAETQDASLSLLLNAAKKVIIIPGYGMALAQAQHKVKQLVDALEAKGAQVVYAIHPVAGRMPGHMNVLLAEANVDYEQLIEMHDANPQFATADLVVIVGANDVVNPAAIEAVGTPIYGMPILRADEAKNVIICNFDTKPGYAGVENPLYKKAGVFMLLGDAAQTVEQLIKKVNS